MLDPVAVERAESETDNFISKRTREKSKANNLEAAWAESERRHREKRRRENSAAWYAHHCHMHDLHQSLAADHRSRAEALLEDPGRGGLSFVARCAGSKSDGTPCERIVKASQTYCFSHDPARAGERKRNASKAGRGGGSTEIRDLKKQLQELTDGVLAGEVNRANAAVCGQLLNVKLRAVEVERKVKETEELEERIEQLEQAQEQKGGDRRWGA